MTAATENAKRLLGDAEALLREGSFASATALAILGIEEAGKVSILRELALARSNEDVQDAWRAYRSHTKKNLFWIVPDLIRSGARTLEGLRPAVEGDDDHTEVLDYLKQLSIYTDCVSAGRWTCPRNVVSEELAKSVVGAARVMCRGDTTSGEDVRLWIKHMGPTWRQSLAAMNESLLNWDREMRFRGLKDSGHPSMAEFLGLSPVGSESDATGRTSFEPAVDDDTSRR